jgi:hypothetical protein
MRGEHSAGLGQLPELRNGSGQRSNSQHTRLAG